MVREWNVQIFLHNDQNKHYILDNTVAQLVVIHEPQDCLFNSQFLWSHVKVYLNIALNPEHLVP